MGYWTKKEKEKMIQMYKKGCSINDIADYICDNALSVAIYLVGQKLADLSIIYNIK